jgi:dihydrofolate reductase
MKISIVVAAAQNNTIGKNNELLWHLPADLKHFKNLTTGHAILMGRKTYESIGRPLPNRRNIVITRQPIQLEGCEVVNSIDEAMAICDGEEEVFVIGGAEIYKQTLERCHRIYLTRVNQHFEGDAYFPELNETQWVEISRSVHPADEKNPIGYSFIILEHR